MRVETAGVDGAAGDAGREGVRVRSVVVVSGCGHVVDYGLRLLWSASTFVCLLLSFSPLFYAPR